MKCVNCGHENPPGRIYCELGGHKIADRPGPPPNPNLQELEDRIKQLQRELLVSEKEIENLQEQVNRVTQERNQLAAKHPELEAILRQLDVKEAQLEAALQELNKARESARQVQIPQREAEPVGSRSLLFIESHPIKKPNFDMTFEDNRQSLDLSATEFHIRASLERTPGGVDVVVHQGATVNVQTPGSKRWHRYPGGARLSADPGTVLFDTQGIMSARLERKS
jgi:hypothetical protein